MKRLFLYWFLLIAATVMIAGGAGWLLTKEQQRLNALRKSSIRETSERIAGNAEQLLKKLKRELETALTAIPRAERLERLPAWREQSELLTAVFLWTEEEGLVHPKIGTQAALELTPDLYQDTRWIWEAKPKQRSLGLSSLFGGSKTAQSQQGKQENGRGNYFVVSKGSKSVNEEEGHELLWKQLRKGGERSWLLICRDRWGGQVCGLRFTDTTLSLRLKEILPLSTLPGERYQLIDASGRTLHAVGAFIDKSTQQFERRLGGELSSWRILADTELSEEFGRSFLLLGSLLVVFLVFTIFSGATLLLRQAKRSHEEALQKTTFVSNVSHELKTPLTTIRLYSEMLRDGRISDEGARADYLETITGESERLTRLVNNVLDFSRMEQGRKAYEAVACQPFDSLRDIVERQSVRIEEAGMQLTLDLPAEAQQQMLDIDALEQVLINLIDNAIKYAASGGWLGIRAWQKQNELRIEVADAGPGIAAEHRRRVFELFHRVDDSLTARQPGCGLGLAIASRLAADLGGRLELASREPSGAVFTLILPIQKPS